MSRDLQERIESAKEDLRERFEQGDTDLDDAIWEIADGAVPVYTYDILQMAAEDIDLAVVVPELGPAFDGEPTPVNIIAANIYERISNELHNYLRELEEDAAEAESAEEEGERKMIELEEMRAEMAEAE